MNNGLTEKEKQCLNCLADAWALFSEMENKHPCDNQEFCSAIHNAQKLISLRVARRVDKDFWKQF